MYTSLFPPCDASKKSSRNCISQSSQVCRDKLNDRAGLQALLFFRRVKNMLAGLKKAKRVFLIGVLLLVAAGGVVGAQFFRRSFPKDSQRISGNASARRGISEQSAAMPEKENGGAWNRGGIVGNRELAEALKAIQAAEATRPPAIPDDATQEEIYRNPYVRHIRAALNSYLAGKMEGLSGVVLSGMIERCTLQKADADYYRNKFVVLSAENNAFGGASVYLAFQGKPDAIFWAWVYQLGGDDEEGAEYELRSFCKKPLRSDKRLMNELRAILESARYTL